MLSVQSLKFPQDSFKAHPKDIRNKWVAAQGVPRCSYTKQPLTGTLPPPDISQAETRLTPASPPPHPHSLPTCPHPILSSYYCALLFSHPHITHNKWVPYLILSPPLSLSPSFLPISLSLTLSLFSSFTRCRWKAGIEPAVAFQNLRPRLQCVWLFNTAGSH